MRVTSSLADSARVAMNRGAARMEQAANEITAAGLEDPRAAYASTTPEDQATLRSRDMRQMPEADMVRGFINQKLGEMEFKTGVHLLRAYDRNNQTLFELLKPE